LRTAEGFAELEEQVLSRVLRNGAQPG
jgi:sulfonate transport system ATP-binding protein